MSSVTDTNIDTNTNTNDTHGLDVDIIRNKQFDLIINRLLMVIKLVGRYIVSLITILMYSIKLLMTLTTKKIETLTINHIERNRERYYYKKLVDVLCYNIGYINNNVLGLYVRSKEVMNKYSEIILTFLARYSDMNIVNKIIDRFRD